MDKPPQPPSVAGLNPLPERAKDLNNRGIVLTPETHNRLRAVEGSAKDPGQLAAARRLRLAFKTTAKPIESASSSDLPPAAGKQSPGRLGLPTFRVPTLPLNHGTYHYAPRYRHDASGGDDVYLTSAEVAACKAVFDASGGIGAYDDKRMSRVLRMLGVPSPAAQELARLMAKADALWASNATPGWIIDLCRGKARQAGGSMTWSDSEEDNDSTAVKVQQRRKAWDRLRTYRRVHDAVGGCASLDYLGWAERAKLAESLTGNELTVDAGGVIVEGGALGDDAYIVAEGVVLSVAEDSLFKDGSEGTSRARLCRGALFGHEVLDVKRGRYAATVSAVTRARLVGLPKAVVKGQVSVQHALRRCGIPYGQDRRASEGDRSRRPSRATRRLSRSDHGGLLVSAPGVGAGRDRRRSSTAERRQSVLDGVVGFGKGRVASSVTAGSTIATRAIAAAERSRLLRRLPRTTLERLAQSLQLRSYMDDQAVVRQGDFGDEFYIVEDGECEADQDGMFLRRYHSDDYFGDDALLGEGVQPATVVATRLTECWVLRRDHFRALLHDFILERRHRFTNLLRGIEVADLRLGGGEHGLSRVVDLAEEVTAVPGEEIFVEGHVGDYFLYVLADGEVTVRVHSVGDVAVLTTGRFFGETGILYRQPRSATVTCSGYRKSKLLRLDADIFLRYLGPPELPTALPVGDTGGAQRPCHSMELGCFLNIVHELKRRHISVASDRSHDLVDAFTAMGGRRDKKGNVLLSTLVDTANAFRLTIDVEQLVRDMDRDSDGKVDFGEFSALLESDGTRQEDVFVELGGGIDPDTGVPCGFVETDLLRTHAGMLAGATRDEGLVRDIVRIAELGRGRQLCFSEFVDSVLTPIDMASRDPSFLEKMKKDALLADQVGRLIEMGTDIARAQSVPGADGQQPPGGFFGMLKKVYHPAISSMSPAPAPASAGIKRGLTAARVETGALAISLRKILDRADETVGRLRRRAKLRRQETYHVMVTPGQHGTPSQYAPLSPSPRHRRPRPSALSMVTGIERRVTEFDSEGCTASIQRLSPRGVDSALADLAGTSASMPSMPSLPRLPQQRRATQPRTLSLLSVQERACLVPLPPTPTPSPVPPLSEVSPAGSPVRALSPRPPSAPNSSRCGHRVSTPLRKKRAKPRSPGSIDPTVRKMFGDRRRRAASSPKKRAKPVAALTSPVFKPDTGFRMSAVLQTPAPPRVPPQRGGRSCALLSRCGELDGGFTPWSAATSVRPRRPSSARIPLSQTAELLPPPLSARSASPRNPAGRVRCASGGRTVGELGSGMGAGGIGCLVAKVLAADP